jgi:hypothetical protein
MEGWGVPAKFGAKVDIGKGSVSGQLDVVVLVGMEGSDKVGRVVVEGIPQGDVLEEVMLEVLFL